jgi:hypothetical protein
MTSLLRTTLAIATGFTVLGCVDLDVANPNAPDLERAFGSGAELESHVAGAFRRWHTAHTSYSSPASMLSSIAFQHTTANVCESPYGGLPRVPVGNEPGSECVQVLQAWRAQYELLAVVRDGLLVLEARPDLRAELGAERVARLRAYARFVQGIAHGSIALLFDRGAVLDERTAAGKLLDYNQLMAAALAYLDEAAELAASASWPPIPAEWMSVEVPAAQLAQLAHSYRARLRAGVARTPEERAAVDWAAVRADAERGVADDWLMAMAPGEQDVGWRAVSLYYLSSPTRRQSQASYFILGMADGSGNYQRWLSQPLFTRRPLAPLEPGGPEQPLLIVTPDTRFPQGATLAEQADRPGTLFAVQPPPVPGWVRPDRGMWRWSLYRYHAGDDYSLAVDMHWPAMTVAELRLLRAEAMLRTGNPAAAAALVNESRTAHGLQPTSAAGVNIDCVPRLPDGRCGNLMEMLKWEKRLATYMTGPFLAGWYFDARGWGDLHAGSFLQLPVPCSELILVGEACYTFGGIGGASASPASVYGWPEERQATTSPP